MAQVQAQLNAVRALLSGLGFGRSDLSKKLHCLHLLAQSSTRPRISHHWESRYTRFSGHISLGLQLRCTEYIYPASAGVLLDSDPQSGSGALASARTLVVEVKQNEFKQ